MKAAIPVVAIVGRANVGKSSLFNRLIGERKAVVADTPGTTRDRVEAIVEWSGKSFWLVDTAGFEYGGDELAPSIQEQIRTARDMADMLLLVVDGSTILSDEDRRVIKDIRKQDKPLVVAINKADRAKQPIETDKLPNAPSVKVSAVHGSGSGDLLDILIDHMPAASSAKVPTHPTLSLLGRPNVGKSSLLNVLAVQPRTAVADTPGTTRDTAEITATHEEQTWQIIDTAGLRRRSQVKDIEYFSYLRTLQTINHSHVCALVIDANEPATAQDQRIGGMIKEAGKGLLIVANKWDLSERSDEARGRLEHILTTRLPFVWWAPLILTSATEKHNVSKILTLAAEVEQNRQRSITTPKLNQALEEITGSHPPAGLKNRHPKLNYITQTDTAPPTFAVYGSHTPYLHWSYKRFIESSLRERFEFTGTPIRLQWREKSKKSKH